MIDRYFHETINTFESLEMEMDALIINPLCDIIGLKNLKQFIGNGKMSIKITDRGETLVSFIFNVQNGIIITGKAITGDYSQPDLHIGIKIPISFIKHRFSSKKKHVDLLMFFSAVMINIIPATISLFSLFIKKILPRRR